ncbi:hypothetical protein PROFUN_16561, partial [Planoprotostelium fungivorum]
NLLWQSALTAISWQKQSNEFSNCKVFNSSTSLSPNMPPKAFETPAGLAQAAKDYGRDTWREQLSYIWEGHPQEQLNSLK